MSHLKPNPASSPVTINPSEDAFYEAIEMDLERPKPHDNCDCMECGPKDEPREINPAVTSLTRQLYSAKAELGLMRVRAITAEHLAGLSLSPEDQDLLNSEQAKVLLNRFTKPPEQG